MANLNVDGCSVNIGFNIKGKDSLMQKMAGCIESKTPFEIKTEINGDSMLVDFANKISMYLPCRTVTKYDNLDQLQYAIGVAFMFCTEIVPIPKGLPLKNELLLGHEL